jgi:hypothetical protein
MYASGEAYTIDNSLRFDDDVHLGRTPSVSGNTKTWSVSFWMKPALSTVDYQNIITAGTVGSSPNMTRLRYNSAADDGKLHIQNESGIELKTNAVFRDPAGWYHVVAAVDTTVSSPSADRVKIWVNGELQTLTGTEATEDETTSVNNSTYTMYVGGSTYTSGRYYCGYLAEFYLIDGTALTPSSFGETDTDTNQWKPIEFDGTYGTNGFYQKYSATELAASFEDSSSSDHTITANGDVTNTRATLYTTDAFTSTGSDTWTCPAGVTSVEYLVVAGGGGGGINRGGGGGGGGYLAGTLSVTPSTSYTVTVGDGGTGSSSDQGDDGDDSVFSSITATGGGGGGYSAATEDGRAGGSGGGGGGVSSGGAGTPGQGNDGGGGDHNESSGGGGGANAAGVAGSGSTAGDGGDGLANSITGSSVTYAGGGGGGTYRGTAGSGGAGGGGNGGGAGMGSGVGSPGTDGLGGGGGGAGYGATGGNGGNGGSGVVVIRYIQPTPGDSSIKFDGTGDGLTISDSSDWDWNTDPFSIDMWVRGNSTQTSGGYKGLISTNGTSWASGEWSISLNTTTGYLEWWISDVAGSALITSTTNMKDDAWHHVALTKSGNDTKLFIDGTQEGSTYATGYSLVTPATGLIIGNCSYSADRAFTGYMDEFRISDTARYTTTFTPSTTEFTADSNTKLLIHSDFDGGLGADSSGNNNGFAVTNLVATDQMVDTPTNNFCTMNPLDKRGTLTLSEGNLKGVTNASDPKVRATISIPQTGKWYWEFLAQYSTSIMLGVDDQTNDGSSWYGNSVTVLYNSGNGFLYNFTDPGPYGASYGATWTTGDIIGVALNRTDNEIIFYKNGSAQPTKTIGGTADQRARLIPFLGTGTGGTDGGGTFNFGQDSSFAGNKTAQGNQDSNSIGDFYYEPPTDFLALCSSNLASPEIALPTDHFDTALWTGNSSTQTVTSSLNFQPDFLWTKLRSHTDHHIFRDIVRDGSTTMVKSLRPSHHGAEYTGSGSLTTTSNGFSVSGHDGGEFNYNTYTYVTWNWKAGGTAVSNTDGSITSSVSANPTAGFSIVSWTGDTNDPTIGHGLSSEIEMIIHKHRSGSGEQWNVYHKDAGTGGYLRIDGSQAWASNAGFFTSAPTASVFSPGSHGYMDDSGNDNIAYCFHSVEGYSKVGSYEGNNNADGSFIYLGFKPEFFLVKDIDAVEYWAVWDGTREPYNKLSKKLSPNDTGAEYTANTTTYAIDFLSNGVKLRSSYSVLNASQTYIYYAIAKSPFKTSNAR